MEKKRADAPFIAQAGTPRRRRSTLRRTALLHHDRAPLTYFLYSTDQVPTAITVWETFGESPVVDGGTTIITEYQGDSTLTVAGPQYITLTFYPTTTTYHTVRETIPTSTRTKTSSYAPPATQTMCRPGDLSEKERTGLKPTHDQSITLCE